MDARTASAAVVVNGLETRYWRCGSGKTVILLGGDGRLAARLSQSCRVIAPEIPPGVDVIAWLRGILEGLGVRDAIVVAATRWLDAARDCAAADPERVRAVISLNEAPSLE